MGINEPWHWGQTTSHISLLAGIVEALLVTMQVSPLLGDCSEFLDLEISIL